MDFFELEPNERLELAGLDVRCVSFSPRFASFEILGQFNTPWTCTGWIDVAWVGDVDSGTVHLRFAIDRSSATIRFANRLRDDLIARLGIPEQTPFNLQVIDTRHSVRVYDDRRSVVSSTPIRFVGKDPGDPLDLLLFDLNG